jgi:hypothetical protein
MSINEASASKVHVLKLDVRQNAVTFDAPSHRSSIKV